MQPDGHEAEVTVIIPTIGDDRRAETIWRTIDSAGPRCGVRTRVLVVVNGKRFSPALLEQLKSTPKAECLYVEQGSLPLALKAGREAVTSEFFSFIDDDDEFLAGGMATRVQALRERPDAAFVVSQGWFYTDGRDVPQTSLNARGIEADPLGMMLRENWVATSASGLYRSSAVTADDFTGMPSYLEWTYLGFRLASRLQFRFLDEPTYRRYDMPGSVSKSPAFRLGMVKALQSILQLQLPPGARRGVQRKMGSALHDISEMALQAGELDDAWRQHVRSLRCPGGLSYLGYTRHLISASLGKPRGA